MTGSMTGSMTGPMTGPMTQATPFPRTAAHKLFCFGFGYSAASLAERLAPTQIQIAGTRTRLEAGQKRGIALAAFNSDGHAAGVVTLLAGTTHLLISIPPDAAGDPALRIFGDDLRRLSSLVWIGYLSTIGVYGDCAGAWVDETAAVRPQSMRAARRVMAEDQWRGYGAATGTHVEIFRLPGIYGPGRSMIDAVQAGTARRVIKPGQVFNRVHVTDIARALERAIDLAATGRSPQFDTYNLVDDDPTPPQDVVKFAAELLGVEPPPEVPFEAAQLTPMGQSFYAENKRASNARLKQAFKFALAYPTYREGLRAIVAGCRLSDQA